MSRSSEKRFEVISIRSDEGLFKIKVAFEEGFERVVRISGGVL